MCVCVREIALNQADLSGTFDFGTEISVLER